MYEFMFHFIAETRMVLQMVPTVLAQQPDSDREVLSRLQHLQGQLAQGTKSFRDMTDELGTIQQRLNCLTEKLPAHSSPAPKRTVCLFHLEGKCNRGDSCRFLHPDRSPPPPPDSKTEGGNNGLYEEDYYGSSKGSKGKGKGKAKAKAKASQINGTRREVTSG